MPKHNFSHQFSLFTFFEGFCLHAHCSPVFSVKIVCVLDQLKPSALGGKMPALCGTGMGQNCAHYTQDFTTDTNTYKLYINAQKAIHHLAIPRDGTTPHQDNTWSASKVENHYLHEKTALHHIKAIFVHTRKPNLSLSQCGKPTSLSDQATMLARYTL